MSELKTTEKYNSLQDKLTKIQQYVHSVKTIQAEQSPPPYTGQGDTSYCDHYTRSPDVIPTGYRRPKYMGTATGIPPKISGTKLTQVNDVTKMYKAIKDTRDIVNTIDNKVKRRKTVIETRTRKYWTKKRGDTKHKYYSCREMPEYAMFQRRGYPLNLFEAYIVPGYYNSHHENYQVKVTKEVWEKENVCNTALPIDGKTVTSSDLVRLSHYNSMLQATDSILNSMKTLYNKDYDSSDRCATSCQVYCQQACQASCQNVNWCHDQKCGTF